MHTKAASCHGGRQHSLHMRQAIMTIYPMVGRSAIWSLEMKQGSMNPDSCTDWSQEHLFDTKPLQRSGHRTSSDLRQLKVSFDGDARTVLRTFSEVLSIFVKVTSRTSVVVGINTTC